MLNSSKKKIKILENIKERVENKTNIIILLCRSMVCPHLEYWVQLWSSPPQNRVELEKVQRRATKMIKDIELTYKEQLSKLGFFHLEKEMMKGK